MSKIFISYRRADGAIAGRIYDRLVGRFGTKAVYIDLKNIPLSDPWPVHITKALLGCEVGLVLIGGEWLNEIHKRLDDQDDYVRLEVEALLKEKIPVIPVSLDEAAMPDKAELPQTLAPLVNFQSTKVRSSGDFDGDIEVLLHSLRSKLKFSWYRVGELIGLAVCAVTLIVFYWWSVNQRYPVQETINYVFPYAKASMAANERSRMFRDCAQCPRMVVIPRGSIWVGTPSNERDNLTPAEAEWQDDPRYVSIREPLATSIYPITVTEFDGYVHALSIDIQQLSGCMIDTGRGGMVSWSFDPERNYRNAFGATLNDTEGKKPVVCISWQEAKKYADWLSEQSGYPYRLLSEDEWDYIARGGSHARYPWGNAPPAKYDGRNVLADNVAFFNVSPEEATALPVGTLGLNRFGVDIGRGNVAEWSGDCLRSGYRWWSQWRSLRESMKVDCKFHGRRGASWHNAEEFLRASFRFLPPSTNHDPMRFYDVGFRVARAIRVFK
jgi:formylglycine-generating enzyme required for sulfatase activity